MPAPAPTSHERQDVGANDPDRVDQNPGNVIDIGEVNENAPAPTSSERQDVGANDPDRVDQNPGNVIDID